jgi:hypothetical protein
MAKWLDKYENGGEYLGTTNVGRNYSPAWGGQFQMGGTLQPPMAGAVQTVPMAQKGKKQFLNLPSLKEKFQPSASAVPRVDLIGIPGNELIAIPNVNFEARPTEALSLNASVNAPIMISKRGVQGLGENSAFNYNIGAGYQLGENDYLGLNYGNNQGTNVTYRHTLGNKKKKKAEAGASIPGSVGFTYARTGSTPSEGPYAKKTLPSAQDGRTLLGTLSNFIPYYETYVDAKDVVMGGLTGDRARMNQGILGLGAPFAGKALTSGLDYVTEKGLGKDVADYNETKRNDITNMSQNDRQKLFEKYGAGGYDKWVKAGKPKLQHGGEMSFYQHGLDWTPRNISEYGSDIPKAQPGITEPLRGDIQTRGNQNLLTEIAAQKTKEKKAQEARTRTTIGADTRTAKQKEKDRKAYESKVKYEKEVLGKDFETPQYIQDKNRARAEHLIHLADVGSMGAGLVEGIGKLALKNVPKPAISSGSFGNYQNILDKGLDIHDIRLKYHNNMILDFDEVDVLNKFGGGNKKNYERALTEDVAGLMHTEDISPKGGDVSKQNILEYLTGTEQPKVAIPDKSVKPFQIDESVNSANFVEQEQNITKPTKFEIPSFYSAPYQRTSTSRAADKWLEDWFYNPETKQKFINYGGTEGEWSEVLNSLENPIKSNYTWGKNQPGGVYVRPFNQASIPLDATVDIGVHEGIHKAKLLLDKNNPVLHRLWNDFTDAARLTPSEAYPEIFRFRQKLGLKPGQTIDLKTMEDNLHLINDGYDLPYKIKDKNKLLEIINKAPAIVPAAIGTTALGAMEQKKKGGVVKDNDGYWNPDNHGKVVEIDSPNITMKGVNQDLIGVSDEGDVQYMTPGNDYKFKGKKVKEYPVAKYGVNQQDEKTVQHLDQLLNFTNKPKAKNGWLSKYE